MYLDTWILPFLNVFVVANYGYGKALGEFTIVGNDVMGLLFPGWPASGAYERGFIDYDFQMFTLGPGAVLAFGWNNIFITAGVAGG